MKDTFTVEELQELTTKVPLGDILNKKGIVYKERRAELEGLSDQQLMEEMAKDPKLIRRPIIVKDGEVIVGYDEARYQKVLG
ncbi:hypothetical protein EIZ39_01180 [Ammoniphilus sp. CFH 90114]|nr:hypothetical protein EIZ39_01180 [Ammoniphilus sp. CFH 90114]